MNSINKIERNKTVTFLPEFLGLEVYKRNENIVFLQEEREFTIPIAMADFLIFAINRVKGVKNES